MGFAVIPQRSIAGDELDRLFRFRKELGPTREPVVDMVDPTLD